MTLWRTRVQLWWISLSAIHMSQRWQARQLAQGEGWR